MWSSDLTVMTSRILLIRQGLPGRGHGPRSVFTWPFLVTWCLPEEGLDEAASRILSNLTSIKGIFLKQFYTFGAPDRVFDEKDKEWLTKMRRYPDRRVVLGGLLQLGGFGRLPP